MEHIRDTDWIRQSFLLPRYAVTAHEAQRRIFTEARMKFVDTSLGGNLAINVPPQYSPNTDPREPGVTRQTSGLGHYYNDAIDNNGTLLHMAFGVPQYQSIGGFFFNMYNSDMGTMVKTGRGSNIFFTAGQAIGTIYTIPIQSLLFMGKAIGFFTNRPVSKYYYLKTTMPLYWNAVGTILNGLAANMGLVPRVLAKEESETRDKGNDYTPEELKKFHNLMPGLWTERGGLNIHRLANRAQRLANEHRARLERIMESSSSVEDLKRKLISFANSASISGTKGFNSFEDYRAQYFNVAAHKVEDQTETDMMKALNDTAQMQNANGQGKSSDVYEELMPAFFKPLDDMLAFGRAELDDGSRYVTFKVSSDTVTESFSSQVGESPLATKVNSISASARNFKFALEGGTGVAPVDAVLSSVKDTVMGMASSVNLDGLIGLAGNCFVDVPKVWESSSWSPPRASFTVELRSPYGNKLSRFLNLYVPLAMLLAAALPRSTGKQSYNAPFICEWFCKGRSQSRLGMMTELSIERGKGNLGWDYLGNALGIDVSFTLTDFSTILHMPITAGFSLEKAFNLAVGGGIAAAGVAGALRGGVAGLAAGAVSAGAAANVFARTTGVFDEDTAFTDYMAVLSALSIGEQIYQYRKLKRNMTRISLNWSQWASADNFMQFITNVEPIHFIGRMISAGTAIGNITPPPPNPLSGT